MKSGVYQIYNPINNKRYIVSSIDIERRLKQHKLNLSNNRHANCHLQNAWNKYKDYLIFEPLEYCEPEECLKLEQKYIDYYNSANRQFGYNIDSKAASAGKHLSEETKLKLSLARKGKKVPQEVVERIRLSNTGKKRPKQSLIMKIRYQNGLSNLIRITNCSEQKQKEWKQHLSEATKKRYADYGNRPKGYYLKCVFSDNVKYYPSLREASRQLSVDKSGIKYVLKNCQGYMKRLDCTFIQIDEQEYTNNTINNI